MALFFSSDFIEWKKEVVGVEVGDSLIFVIFGYFECLCLEGEVGAILIEKVLEVANLLAMMRSLMVEGEEEVVNYPSWVVVEGEEED